MSERLCGIVFFCIIAASVAFAQNTLWSDGTAETIPQNRFELGILHTPARYGISNDLEVSSYLLWDALIPDIYAKKMWGNVSGFAFATAHGISSPTPLLRFLAGLNNGLLLPPDNYVPTIFVIDSYMLATRAITNEHFLTARVGGKFAFTINDRTKQYPSYQRLQTIDYPFIFSRTAFLTRTPAFSPVIGLGFDGPIVPHLVYSIDCSYYVLPLRDNLQEEDLTCWALEPSGYVAWHVSDGFAIQIGAAYSTGNYPFGNNWVIYPTMDIAIGIGEGKKRAR